ncbi:hypothetical protein ACFQL4_00900 [Halosimplex aquaticum]
MTGEPTGREPARLATLDVSAAGGRPKTLLGDLTGDGRMELLFVQGDDIDATYDPHQVISSRPSTSTARSAGRSATPTRRAGATAPTSPPRSGTSTATGTTRSSA